MSAIFYRIAKNIDGSLFVDYPTSIVSKYEDVKILVQHNMKNISRIEVTLENNDGVSFHGTMLPDSIFNSTQYLYLKEIIPDMTNVNIENLLITFNIIEIDNTELNTGKLNFRVFKSDNTLSYTTTDIENVYAAINGFRFIFKDIYDILSGLQTTATIVTDVEQKLNVLSNEFKDFTEITNIRLSNIDKKIAELELKII